MLDISKKIIVELQNFLREAKKNMDKYKEKKADFIRNRKLTFNFLCKFLSKILKKVYKQNSIIFLKMDLLAPNQPSAKHEKN
jgi:hypothetical protein